MGKGLQPLNEHRIPRARTWNHLFHTHTVTTLGLQAGLVVVTEDSLHLGISSYEPQGQIEQTLLSWKRLNTSLRWEAMNEFLDLLCRGVQLLLYLLNHFHLSPRVFTFTLLILSTSHQRGEREQLCRAELLLGLNHRNSLPQIPAGVTLSQCYLPAHSPGAGWDPQGASSFLLTLTCELLSIPTLGKGMFQFVTVVEKPLCFWLLPSGLCAGAVGKSRIPGALLASCHRTLQE